MSMATVGDRHWATRMSGSHPLLGRRAVQTSSRLRKVCVCPRQDRDEVNGGKRVSPGLLTYTYGFHTRSFVGIGAVRDLALPPPVAIHMRQQRLPRTPIDLGWTRAVCGKVLRDSPGEAREVWRESRDSNRNPTGGRVRTWIRREESTAYGAVRRAISR
jgi:hypothetical protein